MSDKERLEALGRLIAEQMGKAPDRPKLRLVGKGDLPAPARMDVVTRTYHARMIRHLRRSWGLQIMVDQALSAHASVDDLPDDDLVSLHNDMHRARECVEQGISLEDAGLIRKPMENRYG